MKGYELDALKRLNIPFKKWGTKSPTDYRVKVRGKSGRITYIGNITRPSNMELLAKYYKKSTTLLKKHIVPQYKQKGAYEVVHGQITTAHTWYHITRDEFEAEAFKVLKELNKACRVNVQLGYTLINRTSGLTREFWPAANTAIFDSPIAINSKHEIKPKVIDYMGSIEFNSKISFPSSAWQLQYISAYKLLVIDRGHTLGQKIETPDVIKKHRFIVDFQNEDNNCVFYCIAAHLDHEYNKKRMVKPAKECFSKWCKFKGIDYSPKVFKEAKRIDLMQFDELEQCFDLSINVFEMDLETESVSKIRDGTSVGVQDRCADSSIREGDNILNILDFNGHALYITDINMVLAKYPCGQCGMVFKTCNELKYHKQNNKDTCQFVSVFKFPKQPKNYQPNENAIKKLMLKYDLDLDFYIDHFIVYDFEAILMSIQEQKGDNSQFVSKHIPVSVSLCDSLTNQVRCFVNENPRALLDDMFAYVEEITTKIRRYNVNKFLALLKRIWKNEPISGMDVAGDHPITEIFTLDTIDVMIEEGKYNDWFDFYEHTSFNPSGKDFKIIHRAINQVPLLGFNSGRYDLNLIRNDLIGAIDASTINTVIKNPSYMCITTNSFKMLDIINYLPAGTSYDTYLKTYLGGCKCDDKITCVCGLGKGLFPYEYITSFDKLNETALPPKSSFDSKFKGTKISDEDYQRVQFVWNHYGMKSVKDLLIWYNNLDVQPFVKAVQEQTKMYKRFSLDMLIDGVSLPSLAEKVMYQTCYKKLLKPTKTVVEPFNFPYKRFRSYMEQDEKAGRWFALSIEHLHSLMEKQAYHCFYCSTALNPSNVSADRVDNKKGHIDGNILISCSKCNIARKDMSIHAFKRKKLMEFNADRLVWCIDEEEQDIYHKMKANIAGGPSIIFHRFAKRDETYIRPQTGNSKLVKKVIGYDANALYLWALGNYMPCGRLTTIGPYESIVSDIKNDKLFGFLECDIETPEHLKEYFAEMCPIFKNIEIDPSNRELIGDHMYDYNMSQGGRAKKSKKLIGSYFGKKILIYTPLLKWYIDHGLKVRHVYSFIKAAKYRPFKDFCEDVSNARREGDENVSNVSKILLEELDNCCKTLEKSGSSGPTSQELKDALYGESLDVKLLKKLLPSTIGYDILNEYLVKLINLLESGSDKKMIGDMMKLIGNSAFGRSGMDKSKHKEVKFHCNKQSVYKLVEKPQFHDVEELNGAFEVSSYKKHIKLDNPIHLSIAIYQLAKLRMLEFYYDCIDYYFDRSDFQYIEMDTDSAYIAFSDDEPFKNLFKSEVHKNHFEMHKHLWFPRDDSYRNNLYDQKTAGLFKEEWRGNAIVALSSKNYLCYMPDIEHKQKCSAKGVQKGRNGDILNPEGFEGVIRGKTTLQATNKGFRVDRISKSIKTYEQVKIGLNYYYDKRRVLEDGISTVPLDL